MRMGFRVQSWRKRIARTAKHKFYPEVGKIIREQREKRNSCAVIFSVNRNVPHNDWVKVEAGDIQMVMKHLPAVMMLFPSNEHCIARLNEAIIRFESDNPFAELVNSFIDEGEAQ